MKNRAAAVLTIVAAVGIPASATARIESGQTKRQAEVNVLRTVQHRWGARRLPGLVNPKTHLLLDNTEAVCRGVGRVRPGRLYARFTCVVRPHLHRKRQGLYVSYRTRPHGRFTISWIVFRRR